MTLVHFVFSVIYTVVGLSGFVTFLILQSFAAAVLAGVTVNSSTIQFLLGNVEMAFLYLLFVKLYKLISGQMNIFSLKFVTVLGVISCMSSHITLLHYKNKLQEWYTPKHLRQIGSLGFYCFAFSTSVLVYFSVIEILQKKAILPLEDSAVIPMIFAFITLKSGLMLLYFGRSYSKEQHSLLVEEEPQLSQESDDQPRVIEP